MKHAIVLCSGGIDSVTTAYYAKCKGYKIRRILFFDYGQKSLKAERKCSKKTAKNLGAEFSEVKLEWLAKISNSLINKKGSGKVISRKDLKDTKKESERYYVPCRNAIFLVHAMALAESLYIKEKRVCDIFVGFKNEGKESYPDTTQEFVQEINRLVVISCANKFRVIAPLIRKDKEDIILMGVKLGVDFRQTHSCYLKNIHCGRCLACMLRKEGFYWANSADNTKYSNQKNNGPPTPKGVGLW